MSRALRLAVGLGLGALFLWLTLRHLEPAALRAALQPLAPGWLALAPVMLGLGYLCRTRRWQGMLHLHNPELGLGRATAALLAGVAANNLLPLRAGDALRCLAFSGWLGVRPAPVIATVLVERLLDLVALVLALGLAVWLLLPQDQAAAAAARPLALGVAAVGLAALALVLRPRLMAPVLAGLVAMAGLFGAGLRLRAEGFAAPLMATLAALADRRRLPALAGWTALVWLFEGATYWMVALALTDLPAPGAAWLAMPAGTLATLLPSTPGHVGTFDFFAQAAAIAAGNPLAQATAFVIVVHVALWLPTTLAGGIALAVWGLAGGRRARVAR